MKSTETSYHETFRDILEKEGITSEQITKIINFSAKMM